MIVKKNSSFDLCFDLCFGQQDVDRRTVIHPSIQLLIVVA
jgi:hypothetical protein